MSKDYNDKTVYVVVSRKRALAEFSVAACLFIGMLASFQYTNYVDRNSNQAWCGIIELFNDTYREAPPPSAAGKKLEAEFKVLGAKYKCK